MIEGAEEVIGPLHATHLTDFDSFSGNVARTLDDKARLTLPAGPWRTAFGAIAYVGAWRNDAIAAWPKAQFHALLDKLAEQEREGLVPGGSLEVFRRNVHAVPIDSQGRFTIPPQVRERRPIGAGTNVVVDGAGDRIEVRRAEDVEPDAELYDDVVDLLDNR